MGVSEADRARDSLMVGVYREVGTNLPFVEEDWDKRELYQTCSCESA
jgi:hypothetical protein